MAAMTMPAMAMEIISSTRVKPVSLFLMRLMSFTFTGSSSDLIPGAV
jgi:hypothetical protein